MLAVGGHVSWAGVTGAAIMIVLKKNNNVFNWNLIWSGESLRFLILVIVLYGLWDTDFFDNIAFEYIKWGALCLIMCLVIMIILNRGLKEVNELIHSNQKSPSLFLEESNS